MKTLNKMTLSILIVAFLLAGQTYAYPPDNAALLYYRGFMLSEEPNEDVAKMLVDLRKGNIKPNEQIRQYAERNSNAIRDIVSAAEIKNCDWGLDFSEGFELLMPHLARCRQAAYLLVADVKIRAEKGDYKTALERCITMHKMAAHVGDDTLISYLVGMTINETANKCIADILSKIPDDLETLVWLQGQIGRVSSTLPRVEAALARGELEVCLQDMRRERIGVLLEQLTQDNQCDPNSSVDQKVIEQLRRIQREDETYFEKSRAYYTSYMAKVLAAFELPYPQVHEELTKLAEQKEKDANEKPEAVLAHIVSPAIAKMSSNRASRDTLFNATKAAIDIYIIKAKTGKLPDELPAGLPKDMFSGKDFIYEKTADGFVLKCQGEDLDKKVVHQYEFKVPK